MMAYILAYQKGLLTQSFFIMYRTYAIGVLSRGDREKYHET